MSKPQNQFNLGGAKRPAAPPAKGGKAPPPPTFATGDSDDEDTVMPEPLPNKSKAKIGVEQTPAKPQKTIQKGQVPQVQTKSKPKPRVPTPEPEPDDEISDEAMNALANQYEQNANGDGTDEAEKEDEQENEEGEGDDADGVGYNEDADADEEQEDDPAPTPEPVVAPVSKGKGKAPPSSSSKAQVPSSPAQGQPKGTASSSAPAPSTRPAPGPEQKTETKDAKELVKVKKAPHEYATAEEAYDAFLDAEEDGTIGDEEIEKRKWTDAELKESKMNTQADLELVRSRAGKIYFSHYRFLPPQGVGCKSMEQCLNGMNGTVWKGISCKFMIMPEKAGKWGAKNNLFILPPGSSINGDIIPQLEMGSPPCWSRTNPLRLGSYLDTANKTRIDAYNKECYSNKKKAIFEITVTSQFYEEFNYSVPVTKTDAKGTKKTIILNKEMIRMFTTLRNLEYCILRFLIHMYVMAGTTAGTDPYLIVPEGAVLHGTSPLHDTINEALKKNFPAFQAKAPILRSWRDLATLEDYLGLLHNLVLEVGQTKTAFSTPIFRADKDTRKAVPWSLDGKEFEQNNQMLTSHRSVFRHSGENEALPVHIAIHPELVAEAQEPQQDPLTKLDLGGNFYNPVKISVIDEAIFDTWELDPGFAIPTGTIMFNVFKLKFQCNGKKAALHTKWESSCICADTQVRIRDKALEDVQMGKQFKAKNLLVHNYKAAVDLASKKYKQQLALEAAQFQQMQAQGQGQIQGQLLQGQVQGRLTDGGAPQTQTQPQKPAFVSPNGAVSIQVVGK